MSWGTAFEGDDRGPVCSEKPRRRTLVPHVRRAPLRQKETAPGGALRPFQNPTVCAELKDGTRIPCAQSVAERLTLPTPCREVPARIFTASLTFELLGPTATFLLPILQLLALKLVRRAWFVWDPSRPRGSAVSRDRSARNAPRVH